MTIYPAKVGEKVSLPAKSGIGYIRQTITEEGLILEVGDERHFLPLWQVEAALQQIYAALAPGNGRHTRRGR